MTGKSDVKEENEDDRETFSPKPTCRHYLMFLTIFLIIVTGVTLNLAETQYGYYAVQKEQNLTSVLSASRQSLCEVNTSSTRFQTQQKIQSETARWNAFCHLASGLPALLMAVLVGSWSDKMGRKFALFISLSGLLFKSTFLAIGVKFEWNIYILTIAFLVDGMCGTYISFISAFYAFAADITKYGTSRTFGIVLVEITLGLGASTGNLVSGYIIKELGFFYGSLLSTGLCIFIYILVFLMPESIRENHKQNFNSISQKQYIRNALDLYTKGTLRWKYIVLALAFAFSLFPSIGRVNVQSLYVMNSPFCWNSIFIGWFGAGRAFIQMVVGLGLSPILRKCMSERTMCIAGTISAILYYLLTTAAVNDVMLFLTPVVGLLGNFPMTMIRAILSGLTPMDKHGAMFGGLAAFEAVFSLFGSVFANVIYSETVSIFRGIIMLVFASFHLIALSLLVFLVIRESKEKNKVDFQKSNDEAIVNSVKLKSLVKINETTHM